MAAQILTVVKINPMICISNLNINIFGIVLKFGRKKSDEYQFPVIFKNEKQCEKLYGELSNLKGKDIMEVKKLSTPLYQKYKRYDYRILN